MKWTVRHGGLMRCCLASLDEVMQRHLVDSDEGPKEGDTHACRYCKNGMRFKDGAWEWSGARGEP